MADIHDFVKTQREKIAARNKKRAERLAALGTEEEEIPTDGTYKAYPNREAAEVGDKDLREMNAKYAFIHNYGGKPAIMTKKRSEVYGKDVIEFMTVESLIPILANRIVLHTDGKSKTTLARYWMMHEHRKDYMGVTFEPDKPPGEYHIEDEYKKERAKEEDESKDINISYYNTWEGLAVKPKKGCWKKFKRHIYEVLCNKNKKYFKYVMRWFAYSVQYPGERAETALIFKGKQGAGKSIILQAFVEMFGPHGLPISDTQRLVGKHNHHLAECVFLYADEAYNPGNKETAGILKNLITEKNITTEPKFRELRTTRNCLHIVMATNAEWIIPATEDERRFFINEVSNKYAKNQCPDDVREKYFRELVEEMKSGGIAAMLYDLLAMDLTGWHPRDSIPQTDELRKQINMSLPKVKTALLRILEDGVFPGVMDGETYKVSCNNLLLYIHEMEPSNKTITSKSLSNILKLLGVTTGRVTAHRYYIFPPLSEIRHVWDRQIARNGEWNLDEKWEVQGGKSEY